MSTEAAILKAVMSLMTATGQMMSITLLWIRISYLSQVLVPSPQGDFLVVTLKILVGILTGPLVSYPLFLALTRISLQAHSSGLTSLPLSVILILCTSSYCSTASFFSLSVSIFNIVRIY